MAFWSEERAEALRQNRVAIGAAVLVVALTAAGARFVLKSRAEPPQKRVLTITGVIVKPEPPPRAPPPPAPPKQEEPQSRLVEVKGSDIPPPDATPPAAPVGPLALATEATGAGDAFNLAGNPGGRSLVGSGQAGEGTGLGGGGDGSARFGWYFGRIASAIEEAFRKIPRTRNAEARVEFRVWADPAGRITRVQLLRSTGYEELDEAIRSVVGLKLREPLPPDIPMPVVYRYTARRPG